MFAAQTANHRKTVGEQLIIHLRINREIGLRVDDNPEKAITDYKRVNLCLNHISHAYLMLLGVHKIRCCSHNRMRNLCNFLLSPHRDGRDLRREEPAYLWNRVCRAIYEAGYNKKC